MFHWRMQLLLSGPRISIACFARPTTLRIERLRSFHRPLGWGAKECCAQRQLCFKWGNKFGVSHSFRLLFELFIAPAGSAILGQRNYPDPQFGNLKVTDLTVVYVMCTYRFDLDIRKNYRIRHRGEYCEWLMFRIHCMNKWFLRRHAREINKMIHLYL